MKLDVLARLKEAGYSTYRIRANKIMGEDVVQKLRHGDVVSIDKIDLICRLLNCQPGDIMEYVDEADSEE